MAEQVIDKKNQVLKVIELMEEGISERSACEQVGISRSTFRTTALREQVGDQYARALFGLAEDQIDKIEETLRKLEAKEIDPNTAKVITDTRKWFASKFLPKQYGDKLDVTTMGKELPTPLFGGMAAKEPETKE